MTKSNQPFIKTLLVGGTICASLISSRPVLAQYSSPVRVLNTPAQMLPVITAPPSSPLNYLAYINFAGGNSADGTFTTPAGGRFLTEFISVRANVPIGSTPIAEILYHSNGTSMFHTLALQRIGSWNTLYDIWVISLPVHLVIDGNSVVTARIQSSTASSLNNSACSVSGYQLP